MDSVDNWTLRSWQKGRRNSPNAGKFSRLDGKLRRKWKQLTGNASHSYRTTKDIINAGNASLPVEEYGLSNCFWQG